MSDTLDHREVVSIADMLKVEMVINQVLIDILVDKGITTHEEIQAKIKEIKIRDGIVLSSDASKKYCTRGYRTPGTVHCE